MKSIFLVIFLLFSLHCYGEECKEALGKEMAYVKELETKERSDRLIVIQNMLSYKGMSYQEVDLKLEKINKQERLVSLKAKRSEAVLAYIISFSTKDCEKIMEAILKARIAVEEHLEALSMAYAAELGE
jgi:hypothetical protein